MIVENLKAFIFFLNPFKAPKILFRIFYFTISQATIGHPAMGRWSTASIQIATSYFYLLAINIVVLRGSQTWDLRHPIYQLRDITQDLRPLGHHGQIPKILKTVLKDRIAKQSLWNNSFIHIWSKFSYFLLGFC